MRQGLSPPLREPFPQQAQLPLGQAHLPPSVTRVPLRLGPQSGCRALPL